MERFKRKLTLLNIPVFEIDDRAEIPEIVASFLQQQGITLDAESLRIKGVSDERTSVEGDSLFETELRILEALLGVEESAIFFIDHNELEHFLIDIDKVHNALLIRERNIVESIEVALLQINCGSDFYGRELEVIQPETLPHKNIVFILKV